MISFKQLKHSIHEASGQGGFDYEKDINDKLKKHGKADKNQGTAGASADAPDAKFKHNNTEHNLEIKADHKAMFGQIELHHDGKKWDVSERSKKKYPHTHKAIQDSGFLAKVNKQWGKPSGDYESDLQMGNVYHEHPDAEPIKAHYGKDRKTNYIQIGKGHGFYHTGNDAAKLGSPELEGKTQLRARMKYRGTDASGKKKYGALVVMSLKDAQKSHHDLDAPVQKEWIENIMNGPTVLNLDENLQIEARMSNSVKLQRAFERQQAKSAASRERAKELLNPKKEEPKPMKEESELQKHRVSVTVSEPDHPSITQRKEKVQRFVRVTASDKESAVQKAQKHYKKLGYKVHSAEHHSVMKEEVEQIDEVSASKYSHLGANKNTTHFVKNTTTGEVVSPHRSKSDAEDGQIAAEREDTNGHKFKVVRATHVKEAVEQIYELSRKTLGSYVKKAASSLDATAYAAGRHGEDEDYIKSMKRRTGIEKASDRLTREEKTPGIALSKAYKKDFDDKKPGHDRAEIALTGAYSKTGKPGGQLKKEATELSEGAYEKAEENKKSADSAKKQGDMFAHHMHMADHHDNMSQWHSDKGRHSEADKHAEKSEEHQELAMKHKNGVKEEVAANNVGDAKIAGTQGDAGKKAVMTKKPLKRQTFKEFLDIGEAAVDGKGHKSSTGGLTQKGRDYYNNKTGGNLQAPVTTKPSKLDPDSKAAKRRKSFCARMSGVDGPMKDEKGRPTRKALALRKWNC